MKELQTKNILYLLLFLMLNIQLAFSDAPPLVPTETTLTPGEVGDAVLLDGSVGSLTPDQEQDLKRINAEMSRLSPSEQLAIISSIPDMDTRNAALDKYSTECTIGSWLCFNTDRFTDASANDFSGKLGPLSVSTNEEVAACEGDDICIQTAYDNHNLEIKDAFLDEFPEDGVFLQAKDVCAEGSHSECRSAISSSSCPAGDAFCEQQKDNLLAKSEVADDSEEVQLNGFGQWYSFLSSPDSNAVAAARLFGFESNWNNVPAFLREPIPSQICMAKINGYLDSDVELNGGIANFEFENGELSPTLVLNAQRTKTDPDGNTMITYSYMITAPEDSPIEFLVAVSFDYGGERIVKEITEIKNVYNSSRSNNKEDINLDLEIEDYRLVDEYSFNLHMISVLEGTKNLYMRKSVPIVLIESGDSYLGIDEWWSEREGVPIEGDESPYGDQISDQNPDESPYGDYIPDEDGNYYSEDGADNSISTDELLQLV